MPTATSPTTGNDPKKPVSLLSLDAGGPQGLSQLLILKDVMEKLSKDETGNSQETVKRPCDVFDMIGGAGTGGLIAIFLAVFKMTAQEALDEFCSFATKVFKDIIRDPGKQTEKLTCVVYGILERHGIAKDAKIVATNETAATCKLVVPVMHKNHVGSPCILRNYTPGHEPAVDLTIAEAMLTTCSIPPIFTPMTISKDFAIFEYVSGDLGLSNPTREIIAEAHRAFGDETTVSCLLSIGCGHPGVNAVPTSSSRNAWINFVERVAMDSEKMAQDIGTLMSQLTLYHRFSVNRGLEKDQVREWKDPDVNTSHTTTYLNDLDIVDLVNRCANTIKHGDGFTSLEQLKHLGGAKVLSPPLPPLATNYVERKLPMEFIEKALFGEDGKSKLGSKRIMVTGIGGCGKTQLIRKFIERYEDLFASTFFIDGSSADTIRRDIVRHVRALGGAHSQKSFDESMVFLSQALQNGERLLIIDNVDEPTLDLTPFIPRWRNGVVIITSRNHSRGQLSPAGHLQLDVMTPDESVELLVRGSGQSWPPAETDRQLATSVAEELGYHPIALVQAISYMYNTGCSPESYITLLRSNRDRLLRDHPATSQVDMRYKTAFAAFDASYSILPPKARNLWHLLSFFRWQKFPIDLITLAAQDEFSTDRSFLPCGDEFELGKRCLKEMFYNSDRWDPLELHSTLATLRSHSLITLISAESVTLLQMHPLVHEWGRLRISEECLPRFEAAAVRLLCCGAIQDNYSMMQYLSIHVESLSSLWEGLHANDAASLAFILAESGMYEKSATLNGIAHAMVKRELGPDHLETITASSNLAVAYHDLGRYAEAAELKAQVLQQRKQLLGSDHSDTMEASASLAVTYWALGRYAEAEEMETEVLMQRKRLLGVDHPDTIAASENLSATYHVLGRYAEAEKLDTEILRQRKQFLGVDHPDTIWASDQLAVTYHQLGRDTEAEELQREVLRRRMQLFGEDHPDTIRASAELAVVYYALEQYAEAEEMYTEVLKRRTTILGERHPDTIRSMLHLAQTYNATQRGPEASSLAQKALQLALETLGDGHPLYQQISEFLASLHDKNPTRKRRRDRFAAYLRRALLDVSLC